MERVELGACLGWEAAFLDLVFRCGIGTLGAGLTMRELEGVRRSLAWMFGVEMFMMMVMDETCNCDHDEELDRTGATEVGLRCLRRRGARRTVAGREWDGRDSGILEETGTKWGIKQRHSEINKHPDL